MGRGGAYPLFILDHKFKKHTRIRSDQFCHLRSHPFIYFDNRRAYGEM
jgi:hypothetical protein